MRLPGRARALIAEWGAMLAIVALAVALNFWRLDTTGYGNLYYAAVARSMAESWHNFLFASYDPGGFVTVDKPPVGFWAQALSVKLLGFSGFSLLLPEALAGVLSVVALWRIVRRSFGPVAGALAALALAVTPIVVVANRDNILEPLLILTTLLAVWAALIAIERGQARWLLASVALVALGFNIKMLEAYLIVPALALAYLLCAPADAGRRLRHLGLAGAVMIALSFSWITFIDLTPAAQRPYVGSTTTNSELELALGYNGVGRLVGGHSAPAWRHTRAGERAIGERGARQTGISVTARQPSGRGRARRGAQGPSPTGAPGPLRLFQSSLGSQISWETPLALGGLTLIASIAAFELLPLLAVGRRAAGAAGEAPIATNRRSRRRALRDSWRHWRRDPRASGLALWATWLFTDMLLFSFARSINGYYVAVLAPAICALAGVGAVELWSAYAALFRRRQRDWPGAAWRGAWLGMLLPLTLLATAWQQKTLLGADPVWKPWLGPALLGGALGLAPLLVTLPLAPHLSVAVSAWPAWPAWRPARRLAGALAIVALAATLIAPTAWTLGSLTFGNEGGWPSAGPQFASAPRHDHALVDPVMIRYLLAHRGEDRYLLGALDAYITAPIIVATGQPVLDMGGFTGADPILTVRALEQLVAGDQAHLFLLPSTNVTAAQLTAILPPPGVRGAARLGGASSPTSATSHHVSYTNSLTRWISMHCAPVPLSQWSSASMATHRLGAFELFTCQT